MLRLSFVAVTGLLLAAPSSASADDDADTMTIVLAGDAGFNYNGGRIEKTGKGRASEAYWEEMSRHIAPMVDGDLNFVNLETVITENNKLRRGPKTTNLKIHFRSHPSGLNVLVRRGFNVLSLANNHTYDYGAGGVLDTVKYVDAMIGRGLLAHAGAGKNRSDAAATKIIDIRGNRIAFAAIGIATNGDARHRAKDDAPGSVLYRKKKDWELVTHVLASKPADFRLLSIHYGREYYARTDDRQRNEWRWAIRERKVDLIAGHHAHVARGIELYQGKLIYYGLGDFMHPGLRNHQGDYRLFLCRDFGLLSRVHLKKFAGSWQARAVEVMPLKHTHRAPKLFKPAEGAKRIAVMNFLSAMLDNKKVGAQGLRLTAREDGTGLWCAAGAAGDGGRVGAMCTGLAAPQPPSRALLRSIKANCSTARVKLPKKRK